jgi:hypothetical protein
MESLLVLVEGVAVVVVLDVFGVVFHVLLAEGGVVESQVIGLLLDWVRQHLVGLDDLLEH